MTVPSTVDAAGWLRNHLDGEDGDVDLARAMVQAFAEALMSAEASMQCQAGYGERSEERVNSRTATAAGGGTRGSARSICRSPSCARARTSRRGCWCIAGGPSRRWRRSSPRPTSKVSPPAGSRISSRRWASPASRRRKCPGWPASSTPRWPSSANAAGHGALPLPVDRRPGAPRGALDRAVVKGHGRWSVAATIEAEGSPTSGTRGRAARSHNAGTGQHRQMARVRQARRKVYVRNQRLNASQAIHQLDPDGSGPEVNADPHSAVRGAPLAGLERRSGGHGEGLRRSRGDVAGA